MIITCNVKLFPDQTQFRSLVFWVEDQKIRHYKIEDRSALRDTKSDSWNGAFKKVEFANTNCFF